MTENMTEKEIAAFVAQMSGKAVADFARQKLTEATYALMDAALIVQAKRDAECSNDDEVMAQWATPDYRAFFAAMDKAMAATGDDLFYCMYRLIQKH